MKGGWALIVLDSNTSATEKHLTISIFPLTLLAVILCGRHDSGRRCWDGDGYRGNHWPDAGSGCGLAPRGGARFVARRRSACSGADVGSGGVALAGTDGEVVTGSFLCNYLFL